MDKRSKKRKTALAVVLPIVDSKHVKLLGGRKCSLKGRPAAFALYEINGVPASLVVVSTDVAQLGLKGSASGAEESHFVDRSKGTPSWPAHVAHLCARPCRRYQRRT